MRVACWEAEGGGSVDRLVKLRHTCYLAVREAGQKHLLPFIMVLFVISFNRAWEDASAPPIRVSYVVSFMIFFTCFLSEARRKHLLPFTTFFFIAPMMEVKPFTGVIRLQGPEAMISSIGSSVSSSFDWSVSFLVLMFTITFSAFDVI